MTTTTTARNGKIAHLPRNIREQLNHKLDDGEPGGRILEWLNALPEVQAMLKADFGGSPINEQNLSNWRRGGYQDWLKQQERRATVCRLTGDAKELDADAGGVEIANHLSAVLVAELAQSARDALAAITDPAERSARVREYLQTLVRVRWQDYQAGRLAIQRERRARERAKEQSMDASMRQYGAYFMSIYLYLIEHALHIDDMSQKEKRHDSLDLGSQLRAYQRAESLLRDVKLDGSRPDGSAAPGNPESN